MEDKKRFSPPVVGGSSLLVIFAVLCLTVFALLSLSTVRADVRLSEASVQAVSDSCPISDTQSLMVQVRLNGTQYEILRWQAVYTASWQPDDSLNVWDGTS